MPPGIYRLGGQVKRALTQRMTADVRAVLAPNANLRDRHAGERGFLLGCGPSINHHDLKLLKDEVCISVSNFFVHKDFQPISPQYHCVSGHHRPIREETYLDWLGDLQALSDDVMLVSPVADRALIHRRPIFAENRLCYAYPGATATDLKRGGIDFCKRIRQHETVGVLALQLALYLGLKDIYLLGFDFDYAQHMGESRHFYEEHEHRFVREGYDEWFIPNFAFHCESWLKLWGEFELMKDVAARQGSTIYNATRGGLLDVFPRVEYESLFSSQPVDQSDRLSS